MTVREAAAQPRHWWTSRRAGWLLLFAALALVAPQLRSGAELVRVRNALALGTDLTPEALVWAPPNLPGDYRTETVQPPAYFADLSRRLELAALPDDWSRAVAISRHLLGSAPHLNGGAIQQGIEETHRRIVERGDGYCGDFVRVFTAIANAAGMTVRPWAFSFDGFGGHGHIWIEVWNTQRQTWQLVDVFQNYYYSLDDGPPLSALAFRDAMASGDPRLRLQPLHPGRPPGWVIEAKGRDYLRRGLAEWYLPWGNNVLSVDASPLVRTAGHVSRALENMAALAAGLQPAVRLLAMPDNASQRQALRDLRARLGWAGGLAVAGLLLVAWPTRRRVSIEMRTPKTPELPAIAIYSSLFPSSAVPGAGLFIRERMFRLRDCAALVVVSPQPWFPAQALIRRFRPGYRPETPRAEVQQGVTVLFPRFLSIPGLLRQFDGLSMALCTLSLVRRLRDEHGVGLIDGHFAYPCGWAAVLLGRWLGLPVSVTLRGTEIRHLGSPALRPRVMAAVRGAQRVFSVSESLRQAVIRCGADPARVHVVGNGVDIARFRCLPRAEARARLQLPADAPVLISVGGLVDRKGFHRVIDLLPSLRQRFPGLLYLVVGGPSPEGDIGPRLRQQVERLGLESAVRFTGPLAPEDLSVPLSAADVFVLATANEGWANVFLEAMACGLPVVTTDVGGNREVVADASLGRIVPFDDAVALEHAIAEALQVPWDRYRIVAHAAANTWDRRVAVLRAHFRQMAATGVHAGTAEAGVGR